MVIFPVFQSIETNYLLNILFIFDRCHNLAVVIAVEYECESTDLTDNFRKQNISTGEIRQSNLNTHADVIT